MVFTYILTADDFLQVQLFLASKNERIRKRRRNSWLLNSVAVFGLSILFYQSGNKFLTGYFLFFGIVCICLYPLYLRWHYKNYYSKHIQDVYKERFGLTASIQFNDDYIETSDVTGDSKINLWEIKEITETAGHFYLEIRSGGSLVIPKIKIEDQEKLRKELEKLADKFKIKFVTDLNWKWK